MKKIFLVLTLLVSLVTNIALFTTAFAAPSNPTPSKQVAVHSTAAVLDYAKLLTPQQKAQLEQAIAAVNQKHGVKVMVHTAQRINGGVARDYARTVVDKAVPANEKAVICVITMGDRQWYVAANRSMKEYAILQEYGIDSIQEVLVPHLKKGNYDQAFLAYVGQVDALLNYAKENGHPQSEKGGINFEALLGAIAVAAFIAWSVRSSLIAAMSNVRPATEASEYLLKDTFSLTSEQDTYLYTHTTVVPKSKSSSSGGGSDGDSGGSGGGGSF